MNIKLLTYNTHSLHTEDGERDMQTLCDLLLSERPHILALQEVNQSENGRAADTDHTDGYFRAVSCTCPKQMKEDNFALELYWRMAQMGVSYHFTWLPVKRGYGRFDEGLALFSKEPIRSACGFYISKIRDYENWKTRMALLVQLKDSGLYICNTHTSRYDDREEPFFFQWKELNATLPNRDRLFLLGDLNNPAEVRGEGYDRIAESGYFDLYKLADIREGGGATAIGEIDGWRDKKTPQSGIRIDLVLSGFYPKAERITYTRVLDGERGGVASDHYGVMVNIEGMEL